ncbi:MAG: ABC transporter ATP-binding protein [Rhodothermia bacterium]|nr:MAG: ABC transporter ATP-binding protein [Rhodothermia bacterium]
MIVAKNLTVQLGDRTALQNISFKIDQGNFLAVLGPNGGGKSTLLKSILGLISPSSGSLGLGSEDLPRRTLKIGYVPQVKSLDRTFPAQSIELVATSVIGRWPHRLSHKNHNISMAALDKVGAAHLAYQSIRSLSGGELQRVFLARAIIGDPHILLLDEPESGIDVSGTADLYTLLEDLHTDAKVCIVIVTHDWDVAFHHATHVLLLNSQQIGFGRPEIALTESAIRNTFGHVGHKHETLAISSHSPTDHDHD